MIGMTDMCHRCRALPASVGRCFCKAQHCSIVLHCHVVIALVRRGASTISPVHKAPQLAIPLRGLVMDYRVAVF